jgi:hypothetical protein
MRQTASYISLSIIASLDCGRDFTLLATLISTHAKPVFTVPLLGQRDVNNACTIDSPFPTEQSYRQAVFQFCENVILENGENLIFTYKLEDSRNNPIYWILRMLWTPGNYGTNWFHVGLHDIHEELPDIDTEPDSIWLVETRQRNGNPAGELSDEEGCT